MSQTRPNPLELKRFASAVNWVAFLSFDLIVLGSLVRATDSGLACPDWPLCYGQITPSMDMQIFLEWFHRATALGIGTFLLFITYTVIRSATIRKAFGPQIIAAAVLFLIQCILGGLTVLKLLNPTVVSTHLINAVLFLNLLLWIAYKARTLIKFPEKIPNYKVPTSTKALFIALVSAIFIQIIIGGATSTNHAGMACPDFPKCYGEWFPGYSFLVYLQVIHRFVAYTILGLSLALWLNSKKIQLPPLANLAAKTATTITLLQILLGVINVYFILPKWSTVSHLGNAVFFLSFMLLGLIEIYTFSSNKNSKDRNLTQPATEPETIRI